MATHEPVFSIFDFVVFFGTFGLSLFIGIFFGWRNRNKNSVENYFLADRKLAVIPTALSLVVTFQSSLLIIGVPPEVYMYGFKYVFYVLGPCMSYVTAGLVIVPLFHPLKLTSVNKYFKLRYNDNVVRYLVMAMGIFYYVLYSGSVIFGTCVALEFLMGLPYWATIIVYSAVTAIYTSVGGMQAVIWTDVLQITIMAMGVLAIIIKSCMEMGGVSEALGFASNRLDMNDFRVDPTVRYQFWNLSIGMFVSFLATGVQQPAIQRINSTPTVTTARRLYVLSGIMYAVLSFCVCIEGLAIYAYYNSKACDPLASGRIESTNQLIPLAVTDLFASLPGLSGLFVAALSSATLSTLSSSLSGLGAVTYDDFIREKYPDMSKDKATKISKIVVFLYGMLAMGVTALISVLPGSIINVSYAFMGCTDGPMLSLFLVSMFYRKATTKGLVTGSVVGMAFIFWLNLGNMMETVIVTPTLPPAPTYCCANETALFTNTSQTCSYNYDIPLSASSAMPEAAVDVSPLQSLYSISFMLYSILGCFTSSVVAIIVSCFTSPPKDFDERCIFSYEKHISEELFGKKATRENSVTDNDEQTKDTELENLFVT